MTNKFEIACEELEKTCELNSATDIARYLSAIQMLKQSETAELLPRMLRCFRDTHAGEVQYELVEACEGFSPEVYVAALMESADFLKNIAPQWFRLLFQSVLNSPRHSEVLLRHLSNSSAPNRSLLIETISSLAKRWQKYKKLLESL